MSKKDLIPLYYAIIKCFTDGEEHCVADVMATLEPDYKGYKLLTLKDLGEALDTAKENGLLDETRADLDEKGELRIFFRINDFGTDMVKRYL